MSTTPLRRLALRHETRYDAGSHALTGHHLACLQPRDTDRQRLLQWSLTVDPAPDEPPQVYRDVYGNWRHAFSHGVMPGGLRVVSDGVVERDASLPPGPDPTIAWNRVRDRLAWRVGAAQPAASEFVLGTALAPAAPELAQWARASFAPGRPLREALLDLMTRAHGAVRYQPMATDVHTTAVQALQRGEGVCQDLAHLLIGACRAMGLAARYVSGYLLTQPPPGQPRLIGADASHAWAEVWFGAEGPPSGAEGEDWWALDPTNDCLVGGDHVVLAWGRDYTDVAPLRGVVQGPLPPPPQVAVTVAPL